MKGKLRINEMYAFVAVDDDGTEGVCAFPLDGVWMPMVGADSARVEALRPMAQQMATGLGKNVEIVRFTLRESIETIQP